MLRGDDGRVGFVELFYDLVFVFAITQVSHLLLHHYTPLGAYEAGFLFLAIWWAWVYTTWVMNRLDPDAVAVRLMLFFLMGAGLFISMAIPQAFHERGMVFVLAYVAMQVVRSAFVIWAAGANSQVRRTFLLILIWFLASGVFWVAGALAHDGMRLALWALALGIEYLGPAMGFRVPGLGRDRSTDWAVKGGHMAERCGLFVIICLGETLLVSGATFADMAWTLPGVLAFLGAGAGTVGMWWVYFHIGHHRAAHQIEHSADPGRLARLSFTYLHIPIVAGVVLSAVASERAIAHPLDAGSWTESASSLGGVALFLLGNGWFKRVSAGNFPLSHMVGIGLCAILALLAPMATLWMVNGAAAVVLALVAVWEDRSLHPHRQG